MEGWEFPKLEGGFCDPLVAVSAELVVLGEGQVSH
jgi:hypothetical protein